MHEIATCSKKGFTVLDEFQLLIHLICSDGFFSVRTSIILDDTIFWTMPPALTTLAWVKNVSPYHNSIYQFKLSRFIHTLSDYLSQILRSQNLDYSNFIASPTSTSLHPAPPKKNQAIIVSILWWSLSSLPLVLDGFQVTNSFISDPSIARRQYCCILLRQKKSGNNYLYSMMISLPFATGLRRCSARIFPPSLPLRCLPHPPTHPS